MVGQEKLLKVLVAALRDDTTLVTLTGHATSEYRIGRASPPVKGRLPFLGVLVAQSVPMLGVDCTRLQVATIEFHCCAATELTCIQLCDRMEVILNPNEATEPNSGYWDFSDVDEEISIKSIRFTNRVSPVLDEKLDVWIGIIFTDAIWIGEACGS